MKFNLKNKPTRMNNDSFEDPSKSSSLESRDKFVSTGYCSNGTPNLNFNEVNFKPVNINHVTTRKNSRIDLNSGTGKNLFGIRSTKIMKRKGNNGTTNNNINGIGAINMATGLNQHININIKTDKNSKNVPVLKSIGISFANLFKPSVMLKPFCYIHFNLFQFLIAFYL